MSKPNEVKTLTPELDEVLILLNPDCEDDEVREFYKQVINTYYLNLFKECLGKEEKYDDYGGVAINRDAYEPIIRNDFRQQTLNNLKNKLGVDKD